MDLDDDVSSIVSSSTDVHSTGRSSNSHMSQLSHMSAISFASVGTVDTFNTFNTIGSSNTVDSVGSDPRPGPTRPSTSRIRNRLSLLGLNRVTWAGASLRPSPDNFTTTASAPPAPPPPTNFPPNFAFSHSYSPHLHTHTPSQHSHNSYHSCRSTHTHSLSTPASARSSNSFNNVPSSVDSQLVHDFRNLASMDQEHLTMAESPPQNTVSVPNVTPIPLSSNAIAAQSNGTSSVPVPVPSTFTAPASPKSPNAIPSSSKASALVPAPTTTPVPQRTNSVTAKLNGPPPVIASSSSSVQGFGPADTHPLSETDMHETISCLYLEG
ncbi:uncharacterized protein C8R40DRAFT_1169091 [Lentinula edodes]|uniref:uncharacterized protein n=1 Tax=Lentinula edodes TaxID=5353 RepID=UPI001E8D54F9|nr:uncharacterized protein C8R40DRAFT_1169091 [Lentinula edodes]KAH7876551.1 hypothetical protein C8R40DRAFT_1169091 [Lentinula edodes]